MKSKILYLSLTGWLCITQNLYAQSDVAGATGHNGTNPAWYVGWNGSSTIPLIVQHGGNYPIRFLTNNYQRMIMFNGAGNCTDGRVAFANDMPSGFSPQARIHAFQFGGTLNGNLFRTDGPETVTNIWNLYTGPTQVGATEKFRLSVPASTNNVVMETIQAGFMFFGTQNQLRAKLNPNISYNVNGYTGARNGYFLLGTNATVTGGTLYDQTHGAFSLLHLNGDVGTAQEFGYRPWMQTGITFTHNDDRAYIGYRTISGEANDVVLNWSDNSSGASGPDNLVFNFTNLPAGSVGTGNLPDLNGEDMDGREIMRLTALSGFVGIGPRFNNAFQPTSTLHQHQENAASSWFQISNQYTGTAIAPPYTGPTVIAASDGLRMGIVGSANANINAHAFLYNQENKPLLFSTNANTVTVNAGLATGNTQERLRIQSAGTPVFTFGFPGTYGINNPAAVAANITRVAISHNPSQPVWRPLSLVHLGYNSNTVNATATVTDGWRPWMDIGTYTASPYDNMYVGLKYEDVQNADAVIGWGRNQDSLPNAGPEHLRFIFAGNYNSTTPPDNNPANDINGLEVGRFYAGFDVAGYTIDTLGTYGRFGVGDFTASGVNEDPTHKLDVVGNGRFRLLPDSLYKADSTVSKIVMVDERGVLRWSDAVQSNFGYVCSDTTAEGLSEDSHLPMNNYNFHFEDTDSLVNGNNVGIGTSCGEALTAKLVVKNIAMNSGIDVLTTKATANNYGIRSLAQNATSVSTGVEGRAQAPGPIFNKGVRGYATASIQTNYGGDFAATGPSSSNVGVSGSATGGSTTNYGVIANVTGPGGSVNYGVYTSAPIGPGNAAIYINGDISGTGTDYYTSDENLKQNVKPIENANEILSQLQPKTYDFNTGLHPQMNMPTTPQLGLIAQEVQDVLPQLVKQHTFPAQYDTTGAETSPAFNYLGLNYRGFIPLLIAGHNELKKEVDKKDSVINALNDRLTQLEQCISSLNLCNTAKSATQTGNDEAHASNIELSDAPSVVLDQNVPNPFAEQTTITYELPQSVQKAQMLFYNAEGKLINSVELNERGKGQLNVFANDLSNGIYTYTLVVDGQIKGTKKMVRNK